MCVGACFGIGSRGVMCVAVRTAHNYQYPIDGYLRCVCGCLHPCACVITLVRSCSIISLVQKLKVGDTVRLKASGAAQLAPNTIRSIVLCTGVVKSLDKDGDPEVFFETGHNWMNQQHKMCTRVSSTGGYKGSTWLIPSVIARSLYDKGFRTYTALL